MQCYSELLPPSAVTHAVSLHLVSEKELTLVIAKTSLLQVFEIRKAEKTPYLSLLGEYELSGTITALDRIRTKDSTTDSLLVACRDAKLSLIKWDHENHRIATTSIHYYENDVVPRQPCDAGATFTQSILTVDPSSRCAALKFGLRQLAILPFRQYGEEQELDEEMGDVKQVKPDTNGEQTETPYKKSFVLSLPSLDEELTDVIDLGFLHNYREPTFGILSSKGRVSAGLYAETKASASYQVLTLDLEQGASTVLATVEDLPIGLWKVVPLPSPIGGALLIGTNEVVHVAQSGKTHAVTVNEFAELDIKLAATEQNALSLKLEDCVVELLDVEAGDVLFTLRNGSLAVLHLTLLGPDVKSMKFKTLSAEQGGLLQGLPSCSAALGADLYFLGSDEANAVLLQSQQTALSRKRSHADMMEQEDEAEEDEDVEDDDLYSGSTKRTKTTARQNGVSAQGNNYSFNIIDTLTCVGPINSVCFGQSSASSSEKMEMVATTGRQRGSRLTSFTRDLQPVINTTRQFPDANAVWSLRCVKPKTKKAAPAKGPDNYLFVSTGSTTRSYKLDEETAEAEELLETEFERDGKTIEIGTLGQGRWVVHCRQAEIRVYEPDLSLSQIIPMLDEASDAELEIAVVSFCDPYLLVLRNDSSIQFLKYDTKSHDVEPIDASPAIAQQKYLSGSLYKPDVYGGDVCALTLLDDGSLQILSLPKLQAVYTIAAVGSLAPVMSADATTRRTGQKDTLTEVLMADLGPIHRRKPYLVLRDAADELSFYEPFHAAPPAKKKQHWTTGMQFRKVPVPYTPTYSEQLNEDDQTVAPLRLLTLGDYHAINIPGQKPGLVVCEAHSRPKILRLRTSNAIALTSTNLLTEHPASTRKFSLLTSVGDLHDCELPNDATYTTGWAVEHLPFPQDTDVELRHVTFHAQSGMYVVSTSKQVDFFFTPDDNRHPDQDEITSRPQVSQYSLHLYSAKTRRIINSHEFAVGEIVTSVEVIDMDISEHTHEVKPMICVALAIMKGEDMPAKGSLVVFQVLPVVSEPDDPETGIKLHIQSRENVKGAVTTLAPFVGGLVGISQGQKIMVRGLKEDGSCLPVAFLDCQCQLATLKSLWKTGLWLAGDSWKGLWLGGFTEDPYKLTFLGKSRPFMEVVCAEFLPFEDQLFVLTIDADLDLHVLQYDPEDPKTASGTRLLHRSTFHLGHWPTSMTLIPSTLAPLDEQTNGDSNGDASNKELFQILITTQSGAVALLTPLDSTAYRRLNNLQGQLVTILEHPAALNPRQYRAAESDGTGSRGIIDGMLLQRIGELGYGRRAEVLGRCGSDAWTMRSDLEVLTGGGLSWL